jgi:hypothetical protein
MHAGWPKQVTLVATREGPSGCAISGSALGGVFCDQHFQLTLTVTDCFSNSRQAHVTSCCTHTLTSVLAGALLIDGNIAGLRPPRESPHKPKLEHLSSQCNCSPEESTLRSCVNLHRKAVNA